MSGLNAFSSPGGLPATGTSALTANTTPVQQHHSGGRGQT